MAGGGIKGGTIHGATDDFGFRAVENPVSVHDLHATMLKLLGFDHERLTFRHAGRDFRLRRGRLRHRARKTAALGRLKRFTHRYVGLHRP